MPGPKRPLNGAGDWPASKKKKSNPDGTDSHARPSGPQTQEVFKRGRGTALTHLEKRQLQVKAKQDVLFEQHAGAQSRAQDHDASSGDELPATAPAPARKHRKVQARPEKLGASEKATKVRGLTSKRLGPGSQILGRVTDITHRGLALSLPNNLTGYVSLSSLSDGAATLSDELDDVSVVNSLSAMFHKGQFLRASVVANAESEKRIDLSINPSVTNKGIRPSDLVRYSMVQAEVTAVEDHGLAVDLGLEHSNVTGFIPAKELNSREPDAFQIGTILLCMVVENLKNNRVAKLSVGEDRLWNASKTTILKDTPNIDILVPGVALEFTVSEITPTGVLGRAMGLAKVTIDTLHSVGWLQKKSLAEKFTVGQKYIGRLIWKVYEDDEATMGLSVMSHLLRGPQAISQLAVSADIVPDLRISSIIDTARVLEVEPKLGIFLDLGPGNPPAFVHISRISDEKVQEISGSSGRYAVGSMHRCRILGFNTVDMLFLASMEQSVLDSPYLRLEDLQVGERIKGTVEKFIAGKDDTVGLVVKISESISGMAAKLHLSDVVLENPEKKFKIGSSVTCRVLAIDLVQKRLKLTIKKSLVNSDAPVWRSYEDVKRGVQVPGTLVSFVPGGAIIQFYGELRGFLSVSQMSEAYLSDPRDAFRLGQVISVQVLSVDPAAEKLSLTCRDQSGLDFEQQQALSELPIGTLVEGSVAEKTKDSFILRLKHHGIQARMTYDHIGDGSASKIADECKRTRIGQTFKELVVLQKFPEQSFVRVTRKSSLRKAFALDKVPHSISELHVSTIITGFINNITSSGVFVSFGGELTGLIPQSRLPDMSQETTKKKLRPYATIDCRVDKVDSHNHRLLLSLADSDAAHESEPKKKLNAQKDEKISMKDPRSYVLGQLVQAVVASKKETQLNVELPGGAQGRVDVSEAFDRWEDIKDRKFPLRQFHLRQELPVRILGVHDSRNHRFLPITHAGKAPVFELSAKSSAKESSEQTLISLDQVKVGSQWVCFVNNVRENCLWVNLSPNIRGRIDALNVSDDADVLVNLAQNYPIGSAIRATVTHVDPSSNRLDLSATSDTAKAPATILNLSVGSVLPAKVTKVATRAVFVQLSESVAAPVYITELMDDFAAVDLKAYRKDQLIKVSITSIDQDQNRIGLSARASRTGDQASNVADKELTEITQVRVGEVYRGFIKSIASNGIFISISSKIDAFVHIRDLSDSFLKNWQEKYAVNDLVKGKVMSVEPALNRVQMSLKASVLDENYKAPMTYSDLKIGDVLTGKVRRVEEFGAFVVLDNSNNVSGLCHRSQMANEYVRNAKEILEEGDKVSVTVLKVDAISKKISFSLKTSSRQDRSDPDPATSQMVVDEASSDSEAEEEMEEMETEEIERPSTEHVEESRQLMAATLASGPGLMAGSFDWSGKADTLGADTGYESDSAASAQQPQRTKRKKSEIKVDRTADLDVNGPQNVADFERLLLGQPNSSYLWITYMAYQLQHGEIDKARAVAERAVRTINHQSQDTTADALNAWIAYLNLENAHGDAEAVEEVFRRACEINDPQEIHSRLVSIYIQSGSIEKADALLNRMIKSFSQDPKVWLNYATFLFESVGSPARGRELLERALQTLENRHHVDITLKFAQLEYRSKNGEPERGRTLFEGLSASFPKRLDVWDVRLDQEMRLEDFDQVRRIFTRITSGDLKPKKAKHFFKRWLDFEKAHGQKQDVTKVEARAAEYVKLRASENGTRE